MIRPALLAALLVLAPLEAGAFMIGADVHGAFLLNASERSGIGVNLRLGETFDIPGIALTLEVGGTAAALASEEVDIEGDAIWGGFGGARLGIGEVIHPSAFVHLGYAVYDHPTLAIDQGGPSIERATGGSGLFGRGGLALDLVLPIVSAGVHVAYNQFLSGDFDDADLPAWLAAGVHAALTF